MRYLDTEQLLSQIVDGESTVPAWREIERLAGENPELWRELAETYRDQAELDVVLVAAEAHAEAVTSPAPPSMLRRRFGAAWSGWAVAAVIAVAWGAGLFTPPPMSQGQQADILPVGSRAVSNQDEGLAAYLDFGRQNERVIGEIPDKVLVRATALPGGGYEVIFIRQIMERAEVSDLYEWGGARREPTGSNAQLARYNPARM